MTRATWSLEIVRADSRTLSFFCDDHGRQMAAEAPALIVNDGSVVTLSIGVSDEGFALPGPVAGAHECRTCRRSQ